MSDFKDKVDKFHKSAEENGYDLRKVRRVVNNELCILLNEDPEKFKEVSYAMIRNLETVLGKKFFTKKVVKRESI